MPVYELGYRHWSGPLRGRLFRWWVITRTGIVLAYKSKLLRRFVFFGWAPLLYFAPLFFAFGYVTDPANTEFNDGWYRFLRNALPGSLGQRVIQNPEEARPVFWAGSFQFFFTYTQSWLTMMVVAIVGPPLISQDLKNKAHLLYFSKPTSRLEYLIGKIGTVLFYVAMVTVLPGLALYGVSIAFSPSLQTFTQTADIILQIILSWAVLAIPLTLLVLALSSLTVDSRYAVFGWMIIWVMGEVVFNVLRSTQGFKDSGWIFLTSIRQTTVVITQSIFDAGGKLASFIQDTPFQYSDFYRYQNYDQARLQRYVEQLSPDYSAQTGFIFLCALSAFCFILLYRRVSAPMKV